MIKLYKGEEKMAENQYAIAYSEVLEILKYISKEDYNKIPQEKLNVFKTNASKDYKFKYNPEKTLDEQNVSKKALVKFITPKLKLVNNINVTGLTNDTKFDNNLGSYHDMAKIFGPEILATKQAELEEFIEWIKSDNINTPFTLLTNAQECLSEIGFQKCRFVEAGSLLMTCIAGSINCIGNVAISNRRVAFNQQINAIVPEEDEVLYLYWLMLLSKPIIHHTINKSLKGILSKGQLSEISFPFPPREIQKQFVAFATQIDKSRLAIQKSLDETQLLFDSLMQKYFG